MTTMMESRTNTENAFTPPRDIRVVRSFSPLTDDELYSDDEMAMFELTRNAGPGKTCVNVVSPGLHSVLKSESANTETEDQEQTHLSPTREQQSGNAKIAAAKGKLESLLSEGLEHHSQHTVPKFPKRRSSTEQVDGFKAIEDKTDRTLSETPTLVRSLPRDQRMQRMVSARDVTFASSSDRDGTSLGVRSMHVGPSVYTKAASCRSLAYVAEPLSRAPPRRSKDNESALLASLAREASDRYLKVDSDSTHNRTTRPALTRRESSRRLLMRSASKRLVVSEHLPTNIPSHFPSVAICMQSGHGDVDEDHLPRRPRRTKSGQLCHDEDESTVISFANDSEA